MLAHPYIAARVTSDTKERFAALARRQGLPESALLKRLVAAALVSTEPTTSDDPGVVEPVAATGKISVRLRSDDLLLLRERVRGRQIPNDTAHPHVHVVVKETARVVRSRTRAKIMAGVPDWQREFRVHATPDWTPACVLPTMSFALFLDGTGNSSSI